MKAIKKNIFLILNDKEKNKVIQLIFFDILISILDITFLAMLLYVIRFYTESLPSIPSSNFILNIFNKNHLLLIVVFFILFGIKNLAGFHIIRMQLKFVYGVASRLSQKELMNYFLGSYSNYINIDSSVHVRKIGQQPIEFCHYVLMGFQQIISQSILILITIVAILIYSPVLFALLLIILVPPVILTGSLMKKKLFGLRKTAKVASEKTIQHLNEALSAFIESNIYKSKSFFSEKYHTSQLKFNNFLSDQLVIQNMPSRLMEVFAIFGLLILIIINSVTTKNNQIQIITLGAFMAAAYKIIPGIVKILNSNSQIKTYEFTVNDLLQTKDYQPEKRGPTNGELVSVEFKNVFFRYKDELVLDNFSLHISQEDFVGLSGKSGKGKTTIVNLLLGFLEADSGSIYINNVATTAIERQQYWKSISYVKQQQLVICDSIINNIILDENVIDTKKFEDAISIAGVREMIDKYPEGMNTIISEDGKNISGGQRQRIAIARALYKDANLIILDEPFNELDRISENLMLQYFTELSTKGKIILLITHNKESLSFCNKIISLDEA